MPEVACSLIFLSSAGDGPVQDQVQHQVQHQVQ